MPWVADGIVDPESSALDHLRNIAVRDTELSRRVIGYGWLADGPDDGDERWALSHLDGLTAKDMALAERVTGYPWVADDMTSVERWTISYLDGIAASDLALAETVVSYSWVGDEIAEPERWALFALNVIAAKDHPLAEIVAGYSWVADDVTADEQLALLGINAVAAKDRPLARLVAGYSWTADGITEAERRALRALMSIGELDSTVARTVAGLPWVADGVTETERHTIEALHGATGADPAYAQMIASLPWVGGDTTEAERGALRALARIGELDSTVARTVAGLSWVADDITVIEQQAIEALQWATATDPAIAQMIASLSWIADDITDVELRTIETLHLAALKDRAYAQTIISRPWVVDDITEVEHRALQGLNAVTLETARLLLEMARPEEGLADDPSQWDIQLLAALAGLGQDTFDDLADVPWFADGIDDEEKALIAVLRIMRRVSPNMYNELVQSRHTLHSTASLPLAGKADIWVFGNAPFLSGEDLLAIIADTARIAEGLLRVPFPTNEIILVVVTPGETVYQVNAAHYASFMAVYRAREWRMSVVPHETAHYYFSGRYGPTWLAEGGAEFIKAYTRDRLGIGSLEERKPRTSQRVEGDCLSEEMRNIRQLNERARGSDSRLVCNYSLGEFFLHNLFEILGEQATGSALGELYLLATSEGRRVTEEEIYRVFLEHTPTEYLDEFRQFYRRWHGGAFLDEQD